MEIRKSILPPFPLEKAVETHFQVQNKLTFLLATRKTSCLLLSNSFSRSISLKKDKTDDLFRYS